MLSLSIFLFVAFLMLFLGSVVLVHDPKSRVNRLFFVWVVCAVVWMVANYLENVPLLSVAARAFFLRLDFAAGMLGAGFVTLFIISFIDRDVSLKKQALYIIPPVILAAICFTPLLLSRIFFASTGEIQFEEGPAFYVYAPALISYFILPCILLLRRRRRVEAALRPQMTVIAAGLITSTTITLTINLFFQNVLSADWFRLGIYAMLFFVVSVAWAIVRHEFLHVRFVVVEMLFLGILTTLLARTILSSSLGEALVNVASFAVLLVLGFAMIRSFLMEAQQKLELQKLTEELRSSNKLLRQADDMKTTMVAIASHQIRGPLGGIRGYLTLFKDGDLGPLSERQKEIMALNINVLSRLLNAVETFLDITKIESGKMNLRPEKIAFREVVEMVAQEFTIPMQKKGLAFSIHLPEHALTVDIDPEKTKHVIFNLLDNAMKYTTTGMVSVTIRKEGDEAVCEITDTGMGVTKDDITHLFGKFERGELVVDRGGSGLGLYVVKMLTEMQHGRVWVTSPGEGKGTTFSVAFPLVK